MITVDAKQLFAAIGGLSSYIEDRAPLFTAIGIRLRDYVRETIEQGGRPAWEPLSIWTQLRTGRSRPLETLAQRVSYTANNDQAAVFLQIESPFWNITQHEEGYTTPERWGHPVMAVPMVDGSKVFFRHAKQSVIPARPIWPSESETQGMISTLVQEWIQRGVEDRWH